MTSSSDSAGVVRALPIPELRSGTWTRFGEPGVLGDAATERALSGLAESTRSAARAQGYAVGWSEGRREAATAQRLQSAQDAQDRAAADQRRAEEHREAVASLEKAAAAMQRSIAETCARVEEQSGALALEVVRTLLGHELRLETAADTVARVLSVLPEGAGVEVRISAAQVGDDAVEALRARGARLVVDAALRPGDAVVAATDHVVDLRIDRAVARLDSALTSPPDDAA